LEEEGDEEFHRGRSQDERDLQAKRQHGMGATCVGGGRNLGTDTRDSRGGVQGIPQAQRQEDLRRLKQPQNAPYHHGGDGEQGRSQARQKSLLEQDEDHQVQYPTRPVELRNRLNLQKEKRAVPKKRDDDGRKIKCFHCQESGHHQKDCENNPIYYKCKEERHMAAECVEFHAKSGELKMYGFAIPDQGFYCIKIAEEDGPFWAACII
jgi:hypothetical protein